jgi:hypothetical protein
LQVTDEQIDRMMRMADLDDSGSIDFREFQVCVCERGETTAGLHRLRAGENGGEGHCKVEGKVEGRGWRIGTMQAVSTFGGFRYGF